MHDVEYRIQGICQTQDSIYKKYKSQDDEIARLRSVEEEFKQYKRDYVKQSGADVLTLKSDPLAG